MKLRSQPVVTYSLIALCVLVAIVTNLGQSDRYLHYLWIVDKYDDRGFAIWKTQFWRFITPVFIHYSVMHIVFNMLCLKELGELIESKKSPRFLFGLVMVLAVLSNLAQLFLGRSMGFGGMSGVMYGLFGYVWMQEKYNPARFAYSISKNNVIIMLVWFVLCWTGLLGPIANWAHTGGLVAGTVWGYAEAQLFIRRRRKNNPHRSYLH